MKTYLFLLRNETIDFSKYSPEDMQKIVSDFDVWNASMIKKNALLLSGNLTGKDGRVLKKDLVKDGPYSEGKEGLTGFFVVQADDENAAKKLAEGCPFLERGGSVEVRLIPTLEFEDASLKLVEADIKKRSDNGGKA